VRCGPLRRWSALLDLRDLRHSWPIALIACLGVVASLVAAPGLAGWLGGALALLMLAIALIDRRHFIEHLARNPGLQAGEVSESARRALLFGI
jgi:hypothetical protein